MNYRIAIPTYDKPVLFWIKTFSVLEHYNTPHNIIDVFVEDENQLNQYKLQGQNNGFNWIITHTQGIMEKRNFIRYYYHTECYCKYVFCMDDDLENVRTLGGDLHPSLDEIIKRGFETAEKENASMWGITPSKNTYFLREGYTTNLTYLMGAFHGFITSDEPIYTEYEHFEDVWFSLAHFTKDGIVRFNDISVDTKYFGEGGIQSQFGNKENRMKYAEEVANEFVDIWGSDMVSIKKNKWGVALQLNHRYKKKLS